MRLLNTTTLTLSEFVRDIPPYAILSHTWGDEEVSHQEIGCAERDKKKGFAKILGCCQLARNDGLEWAWIDTCCIDKTSSAELSEAINSMFVWYRDAHVCYVYLQDVPDPESQASFPRNEFCSARWFTRGWCLQELIAPSVVEFYTVGWCDIGTKLGLCDIIQEITAIPRPVLLRTRGALEDCNIAQKMSWASTRETTRIEDEAYCLLGIFGVNMPMLYGEGHRAFQRLQQEIIGTTDDVSFLLWTGHRHLRYLSTTTETLRPTCWFRDEEDSFPQQRLSVFASRPSDFDPRDPWFSNLLGLDYATLTRDVDGQNIYTQWNPPRVTGRGLHVSLGEWRGSFKTMHRNEVLAWSGFASRGYLVCIRLVWVPDPRFPGSGRYFRSSASLGLMRDSQVAQFNNKEFYLSAASIGDERRPWQPPGHMDVVLSSPSGGTLVLDTISNESRLRFCRHTAEDDGTSSCRTEVWRASELKAILRSDALLETSLKLLVGNGVLPEHAGMSLQHVRVSLQLRCRPESPMCALHSITSPSDSGISGNDMHSDRAKLVLQDGRTLVASIKAKPSQERADQEEVWVSDEFVASFVLRVDLLPQQLIL